MIRMLMVLGVLLTTIGLNSSVARSAPLLQDHLKATTSEPRPHSIRSEQQDSQFKLIFSSWEYKLDSSSSLPHRVYTRAVIENTSGKYIKNIAVRFTARYSNGSEIDHSTETPLRDVLAPGARTFVGSAIYDDSLVLTASVDILAFGDAATSADDRFLPDPTPDYLIEEVNGSSISVYGEITNNTNASWKARCENCPPVTLYAVAHRGAIITDYFTSGLGMRPNGHLAPGNKVAFRGGFERLPDQQIEYYYAVEGMESGKYPVRWNVLSLDYKLEREFLTKWTINAAVKNMSEVAAKPDVWFVARNAKGQWVGWTSCFSFEEVPPQGVLQCTDESLYSSNIHSGTADDIKSIEALAGSWAMSSIGPPTPTPTITPIPTNTPRPTNTRPPTVTPSPRPTPTPIPAGWAQIYLPVARR